MPTSTGWCAERSCGQRSTVPNRSLILGAPTDSADRVVTGALEAQLLGPVIAQERYVVVAWPSGREGRRLFAEAALFSGEGEALGVARQTAVLTGSGIPLGLELWSSSTG